MLRVTVSGTPDESDDRKLAVKDMIDNALKRTLSSYDIEFDVECTARGSHRHDAIDSILDHPVWSSQVVELLLALRQCANKHRNATLKELDKEHLTGALCLCQDDMLIVVTPEVRDGWSVLAITDLGNRLLNRHENRVIDAVKETAR